MKKALVTGVAIGVMTAAAAGGADLVQEGKKLFEDPKLGTNGKSCGTCHPGGKDASVKGIADKKLPKIVNRCVTNALAGKPLDPGSDEMKALIAYLKSLK